MESHGDEWRALIQQGSESSHTFPWKTGTTETIAHWSWIDGKNFLVQFNASTSELSTAFVPNNRQMNVIRQIMRER